MAPELPPARLKAAGACSARLLMDSATATAHDNATALSWHMTPPGNWHIGSIPAAAHAGCLHRGGPGGKHKQPGARQQPGFTFASLTHPQPPMAMSLGSWTGRDSPTWTVPTPPLQQALAVAQSVAHTLLPTLYAGDVQPNTWLLRAAAPVAGIAVLHRKVHRHKHTASTVAVQEHHPGPSQAASCKDQQHQPRHQQLQKQLSSSCVAAGQAAAEQQPRRDAPRTQQLPVQQVQAAQQQQHAVVDPWQSAKLLLAGALSAVVSRTCVAPLERVKMELMLKQGAGGAVATAAQVFRTEGVGGFWKGNALNLLRTAPFKAVNFCAFDTLHRALCGMRGADGNWERFLAGALAGMTATLVCFPLDLVRTRLLVRSARGPYYGPGPFHTLAGILKHEGPGALYTGCLPALIGIAPAGAVFYGVYDLLKSRHLHTLSQQQQQQQQQQQEGGSSSHAAPTSAPHLTAMYTLLYGALAGAASELIVYPVEVVRRRMQMQSMALAHMAVTATAAAAPATTVGAAAAGRAMLAAASHGGPAKAASAAAVAAVASVAHTTLQAAAASHSALGVPAGGAVHAAGAAAAAAATKGWARLVATCAAILKAEGPAGFYAGMGPNMLQVLPSAALSYYTYDTVKQLLGVRA